MVYEGWLFVESCERKRVTEAPSTLRQRNLKRSYILRLDLPSTLMRHENGAFLKRLSHDDHVIFVKHKSKMTGGCYVFKFLCVLRKTFDARFQREASVFKFVPDIVWTRHQEYKTFMSGDTLNSIQCLSSFGPGLTTVTLRTKTNWCCRKVALIVQRPLDEITKVV